MHHTTKVQHLGDVPGSCGYLVGGAELAMWDIATKKATQQRHAADHGDGPSTPQPAPQTTHLHLINGGPCLCGKRVAVSPQGWSIWGQFRFFFRQLVFATLFKLKMICPAQWCVFFAPVRQHLTTCLPFLMAEFQLQDLFHHLFQQ